MAEQPRTSILQRAGAALSVLAGKSMPAAWTSEGLIPYSWPWNFWQLGRDPIRNLGPNAAVEACVGAISQSVAMMPAQHWRRTEDGGREEVTTSAASRVLLRPNQYQSRAEFVCNLLRSELFSGTGYAYARRDSRFQIFELHIFPTKSTRARIDPQNGDIYYDVSGNEVADTYARNEVEPFDPNRYLPARDVLAIRLSTPRNPLVGESPITAAALAIAAGNAISTQNANFFGNMSRPSGVLSTEQMLTPAETAALRQRWLEGTTQGETGGVPVLGGGLKWQGLTMSASDAALIDSYKLTIADIARVFRVPLPVIGEMQSATYSNVETLIRHWIATGLGFIIEHLEQSLDYLFRLPRGEWIEFDTDYLLRSEFQHRIEALTRGISGGLFAPNEARAKEGLRAVDGGDTVYVQQQLQRLEDRARNIPLDAGAVQSANDKAPAAPAEPLPEDAAAKYLEDYRIKIESHKQTLVRLTGGDRAAA